MVRAVAYSVFRQNLKSLMKRVNEDSDVLLVTNTNPDDNVVVMGVDDYDALLETLRVYENPYLRDKVIRGLEQVRSGRVAEHGLFDDGE